MPVTVSYNFETAGWYLVSLPVRRSDTSVGTMFPGANGNIAYTWDSETYVTSDSMENDHGYWLAISTGITTEIEGIPILSYTRHFEKPG